MAGGGKGGGETTTTNFTPEMEAGIRDAINMSKSMARPYLPYQGGEIAALTGNQEASLAGNNLARNALGLPTMTSSMPEAQNFNGVMGYSSYPLYQAEMERAEQNYPDIFNKIKNLQDDPWGINKLPVSTMNPNAGVMAANPNAGVMAAASNNDDDNWGIPAHTPTDNGEWGFFDSGSWSFDPSYSPVDDFKDWLGGEYDAEFLDKKYGGVI